MKISLLFSFLLVALFFSVSSAEALRNPFLCSHAHGISAEQPQEAVVPKGKKSAISQALVDDTPEDITSEWHVIADKDGAVIMQHTDGSIREITIGK